MTRGPLRRWMLVVVLLALVTGACDFSAAFERRDLETPTATLPPATATPRPGPTLPSATPTPPTPTPTPLPNPAPRLLYRIPEPGAAQPRTAPLELIFDQPMDRASVEAAFVISPTVAGVFRWRDARTLAFEAASPLPRGAAYRVRIGETARNVEGLPLVEPVTFDFSVEGYLEVLDVQPAPDATGLEPPARVVVIFSRPVVPLSALSEQAALPQPLSFTPAVAGKGEWLNTSTYIFYPATGFLPATEYRARITQSLTDTLGASLERDFEWRFSTFDPAVVALEPADGEPFAGPVQPVRVIFNQPVQHATAVERLTLETAGQSLSGTIGWSGGATPAMTETLIFTPTTPLPRGAAVIARLRAGVVAASGPRVTISDTISTFRVAPPPGVENITPRNGAVHVNPQGEVEITFASPMLREGFMRYVRITPAVTEVYTDWTSSDTQLRLSFEMRPQTAYRVQLDARALDRYGTPLGRAVDVRFTTGDLEPYVQLRQAERLQVYGAYTETVVYAGARNVSRLEVELYALDEDTFMNLSAYGGWDAWDKFDPTPAQLVQQWTVPVDQSRNTDALIPIPLRSNAATPLPPGIYYLRLTAPEVLAASPDQAPERLLFVKSGLNLTLKESETETLVWATDLATGLPRSGLKLRLNSASSGWTAGGETDADGLWLSQDLRRENLWEDLFVFSGSPGDPDFSVTYNSWTQGIEPWQFGLDYGYDLSHYRGYLYTERPLYRPGQTVYFKGILRADDDARYSLPVGIESLQVRIEDPQGRQLYSNTLPLTDMGTFNDELALSSEAALGVYYLHASRPDTDLSFGTTFQVAEYRKPEYQVEVTTDRPAYVDGDVIQLRGQATYYFGGPVTNAEVTWNLLSSPYDFEYRCPAGTSCPFYSWADYDWTREEAESYGAFVASGAGMTDATGQVTFTVPVDLALDTGSRRLTLELTVTDISGQAVSNRTAVIAHKGDFYIGLAPRGYLARAKAPKAVDVLTVDWDSRPVGNVPLEVTVLEQRWYSVREKSDSGAFYWTWNVEEVPVYTTTVTTDAAGQGAVTFIPPRAGSYRVRAVGRDAREHVIRSAAFVWVWGGTGAFWRQENNNRFDLIADRDSYTAGDTAEILIASPYSGTVRALITIERGHIITAEVRTLTSTSEVLRVPIRADYAPNVFVSVLLMQGAESASQGVASFKLGMVELPVSVADKALQIRLIPDRDMEAGETYRPREKAHYEILATDAQGKPVDVELSLRLADLAVLALADEPGPTLLETFWQPRGVGVRTSVPLVVALEASNRDLAPGGKGGGGGAVDGGLVRTNFADTAFWDPLVRTGPEGRAEVEVTLPDNLTTWRMQARGVTADARVGQADVDVLSTLGLLVRPILPRFFVVGDRAEIGAVIHNHTTATLTVEVVLTPQGLELDSPARQSVTVAGGDKVSVLWPVTAPAAEESVRVRFEARAGRLYDAREDVVPVYRYATPEVVATTGVMEEPGLRQELVQLPPTFDPTQGELVVQLYGSLLGATQEALGYLEHYPYECTEQTVSRFLPNVVTYRALQEWGVAEPELRAKLEALVALATQRLYTQQHYDGGWGWWTTDESQITLTAYALHGLLEAHRAGFAVDTDVMARAVGYLRENLPSITAETDAAVANRLAYTLYVLGEYTGVFGEEVGEGELGRANQLFASRRLLDQYGQAFLAMALHTLAPEASSRVETLLSELLDHAILSATGTHWEEARPDYWNMSTDVRSTAIVLWTLAQLKPDSPELANGIRWLMAGRREGYWESTQTTAWVLLALTEAMRATGELEGDFACNLYLNGQLRAEGDISRETLTEVQELQIAIAELEADQANRLVLERLPGPGRLYYTAQLRYFLPAEQVKALDRGLIVSRSFTPMDAPQSLVDRARVGDLIQVKLTLIVPTDLNYVVVESPFPAGFEGVDVSLKTASVIGTQPTLVNQTAEEESGWLQRYGWGWWWFSYTEMRDEKVTLFATYLPRGTYEYTYIMRAGVAGEFRAMPAVAYQMYFPDVFGRSDGGVFTITGE